MLWVYCYVYTAIVYRMLPGIAHSKSWPEDFEYLKNVILDNSVIQFLLDSIEQ